MIKTAKDYLDEASKVGYAKYGNTIEFRNFDAEQFSSTLVMLDLLEEVRGLRAEVQELKTMKEAQVVNLVSSVDTLKVEELPKDEKPKLKK